MNNEHLSPTEEISLETVKQRAVRGVAALTGRTVILQLVSFLGSVVFLPAFLSPAQYGVFFLISAVINFFAYFSDIGLAAALIQKKEHLTQEELRTTFTVQQFLILLIIALIVIATPFVTRWYSLSQDAVLLFWALGASLLFSSLKTIPSILLERELDFGKLIIPQIAETVLFYVVAVTLAMQGYGISSFTVAVLVRGVAGLVLIYLLRPWRPVFAFSKIALRSLLRFGVPYQANTFLAVVKDDGMTAFLGTILGVSGIGFLSWAQKWAQAPLRFFMDQVLRVSFPAFSRMQDQPEVLSRGISRSILYICVFVFPALVGLLLVAPLLIELVPRYEKWQPALLAIGLISVNTGWAAVTTPLTNLLNAIGKITITFRLMIMWTALTWLLLPLLSISYGVNGAATGFAIVGTSSVFAIWWATRFIKVDLWDSAAKPLIATAGMGVVVYAIQTMVLVSWSSVALIIGAGIISYSLFIYLLFGPTLFTGIKKLYATFRS